MTLSEHIVGMLERHGCSTVFGVLGDGVLPLWGAAAAHPGIRLCSAWHEAAAISMADGHARASGTVGVAMVTFGPGLTHCATPLVAARRTGARLLLVTGEVSGGDPGGAQRIDQRRFVEACGCRYLSVSAETGALEIVAEALDLAGDGDGPVVLGVPLAVQESTGGGAAPAASRKAAPISAPDVEVDALSVLALRAARPVVIAGRGALSARAELAALADRLGALLLTTLPAKGLFGGHPYEAGISGGLAGAATRRLAESADLVLVFGAEFGHFTAHGGAAMFPDATVARIDLREAGTSGSGYTHLRGDTATTAARLLHRLGAAPSGPRGYHTAEVAEALRAAGTALPPPAADGLDPRRLMVALSRLLPRGMRVSSGVGHFWSMVATYLVLPPEGRLEFSYGFSAIGAGLSFGIGAGLASAGRPSLIVEGDGSLMQHLQELETLVRLKIPATVLILNDGGYGAEVHKLKAKGLPVSLAQWTSPDFVAVARSLGADGARIDREDQIVPVLSRALSQHRPFVVDARISPTVVSESYARLLDGGDFRIPLIRAGSLADAAIPT